MKKTKSYSPIKFLGFGVLFLFMNIALNAQDTSYSSPSSNQKPATGVGYPSTSTQSPSSQGQYPSSSSSQDQSTQGKSPASQDLSFNTNASQLANELIQQTGISTDKAAKITQILEDYRNNLASARNDYYEKHPDAARNQDVTGSQSSGTSSQTGTSDQTGSSSSRSSSSSNVDMKDILGDNVEQYYNGVAPDLVSDYRDADKKADNQIKDVFDNDVQKSRYEQVKGAWWKDVKDKVFPSLSANTQNQTR